MRRYIKLCYNLLINIHSNIIEYKDKRFLASIFSAHDIYIKFYYNYI